MTPLPPSAQSDPSSDLLTPTGSHIFGSVVSKNVKVFALGGTSLALRTVLWILSICCGPGPGETALNA